MFCAVPLKYWDATSNVSSSRSRPLRTGRLDRCGTGTGEKPCRIHASEASKGVILVKIWREKKAQARRSGTRLWYID
jgi:hypothetical protein